MSVIDYAVLSAYLIGIASFGLWISRGNKTSTQYFLADRKIPQWVVGFTLMSTLISSNSLVAHPGIVYKKSMVLIPGFLMLFLVLILVAHVIVPFYRRVIGMSAYEYIGRRFGLSGRLYASFGFLMERTFDIGITLVTTAIAINVMTGWDLKLVILGVGLFTMIYTTIGGITAVVWTDVVQGIILIGGGLLILFRLLFAPEAGAPFSALVEAWNAGKFSFGSTELSIESLYGDKERTMWMFMAAMLVQWSRRYICDQHMVQRYLLARTDEEAKCATMTGALLSVPVLFMFNLIGACLYGFYTLSGVTQPALDDQVLPHFIMNYLPAGVIGLMLAAIMAASMSSVSSDLNSLGTVVTRDYFQRFLPKLKDDTSLALGRIAVFIGGMIACYIAAEMIPESNSLPIAERALTIAVIVSAGSLGLFLLGFLTRRATREGCYAGIVACIVYSAWAVLTEPGNRVIDLGNWNFPLNSILIGVIGHFVVFGIGYLVSLIFGGHRPEDLNKLVYRPGMAS